MFTHFYHSVVPNVSGNFRETFLEIFCLVDNLSQQKLLGDYISIKYNFTAVNKCFISINPGKFLGGNFLRRKTPRKIFLAVLSNFRNFFRQGGYLGKFRGKFYE